MWARSAVVGMLTLLAACLVDADNPCSANQEISSDGGSCICIEGAVPNTNRGGCTLCGDNEVAVGTSCECVEGLFRSPSSGECEPGSFGRPCSGDSDCVWEDAPLCRDGLCTFDCDAVEDCPEMHRCAEDPLDASSSVCIKPAGMGDTCSPGPDACPEEADTCVTNPGAGYVCAMSCTDDASVCDFAGVICCDLTVFIGMKLCTPEADCITN